MNSGAVIVCWTMILEGNMVYLFVQGYNVNIKQELTTCE